jgi:galactonate dehydratase
VRISGVEVFAVANPSDPPIGGRLWIFVRLDTDEGVAGYGEISVNALPWRPAVIAQMTRDLVEDHLVGQEISDVEALYFRLYNSAYSHASDLTKSAITSGLEVACSDALGKAMGVPSHALLGGRLRDRVRSYTYIAPGPDDTHLSGSEFWQSPQAVAARAVQYVDSGFTALKFDPLPGLMGGQDHLGQMVPVQLSLDLLAHAEEIVGAIREAVGARCDLLVGTHGQMTAAGALRLAKRLEKYDPLWFEEPVPPEMPDEMAKVARGTTIPITAGERLTSKWEFARLIDAGGVAICNLDVGQVGGLLEAKKIAALAESHYVQISPHVYGGPLVAAASIQLSLCCPNFLIMEGNGTYSGIYRELVSPPIEWSGGYFVPSARPGLGHDLNEDVARALAPKG